jgi:hypothetical protein
LQKKKAEAVALPLTVATASGLGSNVLQQKTHTQGGTET